ncbi:MAG: HNH endonuclease [Thermoplasmata archaeon]|nr:HNH endonuclease [Thermoplasmata archaeon]
MTRIGHGLRREPRPPSGSTKRAESPVTPYSEDRLDEIFDYGGGECACCEKQLARLNYADLGSRGAWEVDHRVPLSRGGSNNLRNLQPMCISCNRAKVDRGHCSACGCRRD